MVMAIKNAVTVKNSLNFFEHSDCHYKLGIDELANKETSEAE